MSLWLYSFDTVTNSDGLLNQIKGRYNMRGDEVRYAMEHAEPELARAIWEELMTCKPSMDKVRESKVREIERRAIKARQEYERNVAH